MHNTEKCVDTFLLTIGSVYSLANIEHILGIIILVIQLVWIIAKIVVKFVNAIKNGEPLDLGDEKELLDDLQDGINKTLTKDGDKDTDEQLHE